MQIEGTIALVTGANRGIGKAFAQALLERGAVKVYAVAEPPYNRSHDDQGLSTWIS
jgi:NAD(P)-dependent dehydrogenase (short-subunit alcohol dehydrogenase family)